MSLQIVIIFPKCRTLSLKFNGQNAVARYKKETIGIFIFFTMKNEHRSKRWSKVLEINEWPALQSNIRQPFIDSSELQLDTWSIEDGSFH